MHGVHGVKRGALSAYRALGDREPVRCARCKDSAHGVAAAARQRQVDVGAGAGADAALLGLADEERELPPVGLVEVDADVQHLPRELENAIKQ